MIRIGTANLVPFGKTVESDPSSGILAWVFDIIWLLTFGLWIAVAHVVSASALVVTIIGIPFAWQHIKLVPVALLPFRFVLRAA